MSEDPATWTYDTDPPPTDLPPSEPLPPVEHMRRLIQARRWELCSPGYMVHGEGYVHRPLDPEAYIALWDLWRAWWPLVPPPPVVQVVTEEDAGAALDILLRRLDEAFGASPVSVYSDTAAPWTALAAEEERGEKSPTEPADPPRLKARQKQAIRELAKRPDCYTTSAELGALVGVKGSTIRKQVVPVLLDRELITSRNDDEGQGYRITVKGLEEARNL